MSEPSRNFATELVERGYRLWLQTRTRFSPTERQRLFGVTILIGGACGLVAVLFHQTIQWCVGIAVEPAFAANLWIVWGIAVPTLGALAGGILLAFVPGARGSGVPLVKVAYATTVSRLRLRDALGKFGIVSLQIGTGSSLGREGPTVQICCTVAKKLGSLLGISAQNLKLLLPVGSAAGIAAAFNAPIAAVTFTIEEIVGTLDQTLLSGVIVAAALAAVVERSVLGQHPVFAYTGNAGLEHASSLVIYAAMGVAAALMSVGFTESLLWVRARFDRSRLPIWIRPMFGGLATGALAVGTLLVVDATGITGNGYHTLESALAGKLGVQVLLVLGVVKLLATAFSYGTGGAGGIFAPSLFMGAMLGGAFGALDVEVFGHTGSELGSFALVGMGAVFAGTIRAPITSVLIIIEMTGGYGLTLPLMIANMMSYGLARQLRPVPIYEALLAQDGVNLHARKPQKSHLDDLAIDRITLAENPVVFSPSARVPELLALAAEAGRQEVFPVIGPDRRITGIIVLDDLAALASELDLDGLVRAADVARPATVITRQERVARVLELMQATGFRELPVTDASGKLLGLIDEPAIAHAYLRARALEHDPGASGVRPIVGP